MVRGVRDLQERIAVLERDAAARVTSLHYIRARTSRVLAATSAFTALKMEVSSLSHVLRTLSGLARVSAESVDRGYIERELSRLNEEMQALSERFSRELVTAAESEPPPPPSTKRWWRFWH